MPDDMLITVTGLVRDEGTIVLLSGLPEGEDHEVVFACEHRCAGDILAALEDGEDVTVEVADYLIVSR